MKEQKFAFQPTRYLHPSYWLLWMGLGLMWLTAQLPYRLQMALGSLLGWLMYHFIPARRRIAKINLELCFPEKSADERQQLLRRHFDSLGKGTIETAMAWWTPAKCLQRLQHIEGLSTWKQPCSKARALSCSVRTSPVLNWAAAYSPCTNPFMSCTANTVIPCSRP